MKKKLVKLAEYMVNYNQTEFGVIEAPSLVESADYAYDEYTELWDSHVLYPDDYDRLNFKVFFALLLSESL